MYNPNSGRKNGEKNIQRIKKRGYHFLSLFTPTSNKKLKKAIYFRQFFFLIFSEYFGKFCIGTEMLLNIVLKFIVSKEEEEEERSENTQELDDPNTSVIHTPPDSPTEHKDPNLQIVNELNVNIDSSEEYGIFSPFCSHLFLGKRLLIAQCRGKARRANSKK